VDRFFSESNLKTLMLLDVIRSQGITSMEIVQSAVIVKRLPHWQRAA
jgi:hypothetical protein